MTSVFALHDESGRVHSLVGFEASEGFGMSLVPEPGLTVRVAQSGRAPEAGVRAA